MGEDHLQAPIHVFEPGLDLGLGQLSFSQAGGLRGGSGFGRSGIEDVLSQTPMFCARTLAGSLAGRLTRLRPANLA